MHEAVAIYCKHCINQLLNYMNWWQHIIFFYGHDLIVTCMTPLKCDSGHPCKKSVHLAVLKNLKLQYHISLDGSALTEVAHLIFSLALSLVTAVKHRQKMNGSQLQHRKWATGLISDDFSSLLHPVEEEESEAVHNTSQGWLDLLLCFSCDCPDVREGACCLCVSGCQSSVVLCISLNVLTRLHKSLIWKQTHGTSLWNAVVTM